MEKTNEQPATEETPTTETQTKDSSPQVPESEEPSSKLDIEFEEPDFSAITEFVESDGEVEPPVKPPVDEVAALDEETPPKDPPPEAGSEEQPKPKEEVPPVEVKEEKPKDPPPDPEPKPAAETPPVEEPAPKPEPEPAPEPVKVLTKEELQGLYAEHREKTLPIFEELFALSEEDATALDEAPSKVIPKLAGRMMYDTMLSTYNAVISALPSMFDTYLSAVSTASEAKGDFYKAWPALDNKSSAKATSAAINAYRSANPRAELAEIIKGAGVMAMINLGFDPLKKPTEELTQVPAKQTLPAKPAAPRGASPTPPISPGGEETNMFSELAELFDKDNL